MNRTTLALSLMLLGACGGGAPPLEAAFVGNWWFGTATFDIANYWGPLGALGTGVVVKGEHTVDIEGICPDGSGAVDAKGSGDSATWSGTFSCTAVQSADCASYVVSYTTATASLNGPNQLTIVATGSTLACGVTGSATMTYVAPRGL
jgi:hypothetical protein